MEIWIVIRTWYDTTEVLGAFTSAERADKAVAEAKEKTGDCMYQYAYDILKVDADRAAIWN